MGFSEFEKWAIPIVLLGLVITIVTLVSANYPNKPSLCYKAGGPILTSPALKSDGGVVFGASDMHVYALDINGKEQWRFSLARSFGNPGSPIVGHDGDIYLSASDSNIYALRANGALRWRFQCNSAPDTGLAASDDALYFTTQDGELYSLTSAGMLRWRSRIETNSYCAPIVAAEGTVFVGTLGGRVFAFNQNGSTQWKTDVGPFVSGMILSSPETILVGCANNRLYAIGTNGTQKWTFQARAALGGGIAVGSHRIIYFGTMDGALYAVAPDGVKLWTFEAKMPIESGPAVGTHDCVYVSAGNTLFKVGSAGAEQAKWILRKRDKGQTFNPSSPLIDDRGNIWVGTWDGGMYRLAANEHLAISSWPLAGQNRKRTSSQSALKPKKEVERDGADAQSQPGWSAR